MSDLPDPPDMFDDLQEPKPWDYPGPDKVLSQTEAYLLQQCKELRFLVGILLIQTGMPVDRIDQANEYAKKSAWEVDQHMLNFIGERFRATPEGKEASRKAREEHEERQRAAWREECLATGRIVPDPTKKA